LSDEETPDEPSRTSFHCYTYALRAKSVGSEYTYDHLAIIGHFSAIIVTVQRLVPVCATQARYENNAASHAGRGKGASGRT
jgi:hypothetical protein